MAAWANTQVPAYTRTLWALVRLRTRTGSGRPCLAAGPRGEGAVEGRESRWLRLAEPVRLKAKGQARRVLIELPAQEARLDPRIRKQERGGVPCILLPGRGEAPGGLLPGRGEAPGGLMGGMAAWRCRIPHGERRGPHFRAWSEDLWLTGKVSLDTCPKPRDLFRLAAGRHTLTLRLSPEQGEFPHRIARVWVPNGLWFRAPGWDPQADCRKSLVKRRYGSGFRKD